MDHLDPETPPAADHFRPGDSLDLSPQTANSAAADAAADPGAAADADPEPGADLDPGEELAGFVEAIATDEAAEDSVSDDAAPDAPLADAEEVFAPGETIHDVATVRGMYQNWFLDYASYVILERAVPAIEDGLKPVQRRILHAMREMDDGRFNKVANVIGQTMQYHPHGDASIGDAMVNLGQKDLLMETQGNWGDIRTGDSAAAPR